MRIGEEDEITSAAWLQQTDAMKANGVIMEERRSSIGN